MHDRYKNYDIMDYGEKMELYFEDVTFCPADDEGERS